MDLKQCEGLPFGKVLRVRFHFNFVIFRMGVDVKWWRLSARNYFNAILLSVMRDTNHIQPQSSKLVLSDYSGVLSIRFHCRRHKIKKVIGANPRIWETKSPRPSKIRVWLEPGDRQVY